MNLERAKAHIVDHFNSVSKQSSKRGSKVHFDLLKSWIIIVFWVVYDVNINQLTRWKTKWAIGIDLSQIGDDYAGKDKNRLSWCFYHLIHLILSL
jgi:hypothetical protein